MPVHVMYVCFCFPVWCYFCLLECVCEIEGGSGRQMQVALVFRLEVVGGSWSEDTGLSLSWLYLNSVLVSVLQPPGKLISVTALLGRPNARNVLFGLFKILYTRPTIGSLWAYF